jgi:hypothetical protein
MPVTKRKNPIADAVRGTTPAQAPNTYDAEIEQILRKVSGIEAQPAKSLPFRVIDFLSGGLTDPDTWIGATENDAVKQDLLSRLSGLLNPPALKGGAMAGAMAMVPRLPRIANPIRAYHGSPHNYAAERLIEWPNGRQEYLVGKPDILPNLPKGATAIQDFPLGRQRMDKIGTGEGLQAYGHGLYQGGVVDTARGYRYLGADPELKIKGRRIEDVYASIDRNAARLPNEAASKEYAKLQILEDLGHEGDELAIRERAKNGSYSPEALAWFEKDVAPHFTRKGRLYEVDIHANPEDFLDWDKPLSQQTAEKVKGIFIPPEELGMSPWVRALNNTQRQVSSKPYPYTTLFPNPYILKRRGTSEFGLSGLSGADVLRMIGSNDAPTGHQVYTRLKAALGAQDKATKALKEADIPGIKYLDQFSQAAGEGTRNYVVFDDRLIEIVKKYGIAAAVGAGLINEGQARQLQAQGYE